MLQIYIILSNSGFCTIHVCIGLDWIGLDWIELDWIGLDWRGVDWIGLDWFRLDWIGLDSTEVGSQFFLLISIYFIYIHRPNIKRQVY